VIHYDMPDCLENYYQEAGRAGRDGNRAYAVLLFSSKDIHDLKQLIDTRFPPTETIQHIYQSLADYLHIAVGAGEGIYYDFDLINFCKNFSLDTLQVTAVLKLLEKNELLSFNETLFLPSQVGFSTSKAALNNLADLYPQLTPIVQCLLRMYEGIFDNRVSISEKQIAKVLKITVLEVQKQLAQLASLEIITYWPVKNTPQILFLTGRAPAKYLLLNTQAYAASKRRFLQRLNSMLDYANNTVECRSKLLAAYFGDDSVLPCGICDACLNKKHIRPTTEQFDLIRKYIEEAIKAGNSLKEINSQHRFQKNAFKAVMHYLEQEEYLQTTPSGTLIWLK
jgi:ATP-dependent DNA helicase RecQ